jgi:hypothetical protein
MTATPQHDERPQDAVEIADLSLDIANDDAEQVKGGAIRKRTADPDDGGEIARP